MQDVEGSHHKDTYTWLKSTYNPWLKLRFLHFTEQFRVYTKSFFSDDIIKAICVRRKQFVFSLNLLCLIGRPDPNPTAMHCVRRMQ